MNGSLKPSSSGYYVVVGDRKVAIMDRRGARVLHYGTGKAMTDGEVALEFAVTRAELLGVRDRRRVEDTKRITELKVR